MKVKITAYNSEGAGIGRIEGEDDKINGKVVFVPFTAIGDYVEVNPIKNTGSVIYGELVQVIQASTDRITGVCDCTVFGQCGGCDFRHITYSAELKAKERFVRDGFTRIDGGRLTPEFLPIVPSDNVNYYRNNVQLHITEDSCGGIVYGFLASKSKTVIAHKGCKLYSAEMNECIKRAVGMIQERGKRTPQKICVRRGHYSGETNATAFHMKGYEVITGNKKITDTMCGVKVEISPSSFYQVNTPAAEKLYAIVADFVQPDNAVILDLYCGIGTIGLSLAKRAKEIIGIERDEVAVKNAVSNARLNNINNARFICGDAGDFSQKITPDAVILDPVRRGCDISVLEKTANLCPKKIIMVSCNPATAARDCSRLYKLGYNTVKVAAVDLFPRTRHIECVALLNKGS
ncbi:MAG: class I SAM-dependent RNA methyltransferase [Oscillospiraceae bacterium]|nr:class I SAM-dependent RNA methyltransferase [Oscillospiraceae bacterium]